MKVNKYIYGLATVALMAMVSGCSDNESFVEDLFGDDSSIIHVGGIQNSAVETTLGGFTSRAAGDNTSVDAETVEWLLGPLFGGLDITYGAKGKSDTEKVAILKLQKKVEGEDISASNIKYSEYSTETEKLAEYSFKYLGKDEDAKWYDNGEHYFQGVFVPEKLRYKPASSETVETVNSATSTKAPNLKTDQSKDVTDNVDANYTLLERYLGMPADAYIHATVGRIKLPFRHRLARVQAYVLIDPTMGTGVTVKGYKKNADGTDATKEDATTSSIRFCNVKVLAGVKEVDDANGHATLIPQWDQARKAIPHFVEESGSKNSKGEPLATDFIMYYDTELKTYIFPTNDDDWVKANDAWNSAYTSALGGGTSDDDKRKAADKADAASGYKRTLYGKVPVYDLIVRPTYKSEDMVMYDEEDVINKRSELAGQTNKIDFEITLNNGLEYTKEFEFDLDANYQNVVYLRINRESIDYNSSGAEVWKETEYPDGYYGVNNQNGNTLSFAGSSWQRAYRIGSTNPNITDGHYYGQDDTTDDNSKQDDDVMPNYPQYVNQTQWVEMFAEAYMDPVTGTKGLHHGDYFILDSDITIDARQLPDNFVFTGHLDGQDNTITLTGMGEKVVDVAAWDEDNYVLAQSGDYSSTLYIKNGDVYNVYVMPTLYVYHEAVAATYYATVDEYNEAKGTHLTTDEFNNLSTEDKIKTPAQEAEYVEASPQPTIAQMMSGTYCEKGDDDTYIIHHPTLYANHPIHHDEVSHTSGTTLFAGLNGAYSAAIGEANVHKEGDIYVPYVDAVSKTGWRAEVINTKISGADMFPASVIVGGKYDVTKVSGYVYNCWKKASPKDEKILPHTPTLPKYK